MRIYRLQSPFGCLGSLPLRHEATPEIWQETYISAILRAILYSDDPNHYLEGYRKLDPITTLEGELRFLQAAETLFDKGKDTHAEVYALLFIIHQAGKLARILKSKSRPLYPTI